MNLEEYFAPFRERVIGYDKEFESPFGTQKIVYADWTASGRMYKGIEDRFQNEILPLVANTHTETTVTGTAMTQAYHLAKKIIKKHVNAGEKDVMLFSGSGMTGAVSKFQRILGFKYSDHLEEFLKDDKWSPEEGIPLDESKLPVVFITHMEHHSNQTSWLETIAVVEIIAPNEEGLLDLNDLAQKLEKHKHRRLKIASITGCSNVTGIKTPYREVAKMMHDVDGYCFVDFACSGPYVDINMHPDNEEEHLDAIFLSPHKFLGGPGTPGVVVFNSELYNNKVPDQPGGGTVTFTTPWGTHGYFDDIETREDGGTPPFLQGIKTAMAVKLKEEMGVEKILKREEELLEIVFDRFDQMPEVILLANQHRDRLGVISFYVEGFHYNLFVKMLNDRFGIQTRGGCACAGTYGHILLNVNRELSDQISCEIEQGNNSEKPGWVRMSIHPVMTNKEVEYIMDSIEETIKNRTEWSKEYNYNPASNEFTHKDAEGISNIDVKEWYKCK